MDQNEPPHKGNRRPSLLADPASAPAPIARAPVPKPSPSARSAPAADNGAATGALHTSTPDRRRVWLLVLALVVVVLLVWLFLGSHGEQPKRVVPAQSSATTGAAVLRDGSSESSVTAANAMGARGDHAVILPQSPHANGAGGTVMNMPALQPGQSATVAISGNALDHLAAVVDGDPVAAKPVVHHRRRAPRRTDSDVSLLTALLEHVESHGSRHQTAAVDPALVAMKRCPAANTGKGMSCRTRVCKKYVGRSPACPEPTPAADD